MIIKKDAMGEMQLPDYALWGAQTQRAVENFQVSDLRIPLPLIRSLACIKQAAAKANAELGLLDTQIAVAISEAADDVIEGEHNDQFPIDVFQTGSGTSWNMNINEVLAELASRKSGLAVHPNDHVNKGQSSNDVIPTSLNIALAMEHDALILAIADLEKVLSDKVEEFKDVLKLGRTHLQDAVPMTLGQEFSAFHVQISKCRKRINSAAEELHELPLGGTALGTGLNTHKEFASKAAVHISEKLGKSFYPEANFFEAIASREVILHYFGQLNTLATALFKIGQDLRILASGPRAGFGEINLPSLQPGSSIMPGKINPVMPEMIIQLAVFVSGKMTSVTMAAQNAPLQLNIMQPLLAYESLTAVSCLSRGIKDFTFKCIAGITANKENCLAAIEKSLAMVTPLALKIGYDEASRIAYRAYNEKRTVREIALEEKVLPEDELTAILDPSGMV